MSRTRRPLSEWQRFLQVRHLHPTEAAQEWRRMKNQQSLSVTVHIDAYKPLPIYDEDEEEMPALESGYEVQDDRQRKLGVEQWTKHMTMQQLLNYIETEWDKITIDRAANNHTIILTVQRMANYQTGEEELGEMKITGNVDVEQLQDALLKTGKLDTEIHGGEELTAVELGQVVWKGEEVDEEDEKMWIEAGFTRIQSIDVNDWVAIKRTAGKYTWSKPMDIQAQLGYVIFQITPQDAQGQWRKRKLDIADLSNYVWYHPELSHQKYEDEIIAKYRAKYPTVAHYRLSKQSGHTFQY